MSSKIKTLLHDHSETIKDNTHVLEAALSQAVV